MPSMIDTALEKVTRNCRGDQARQAGGAAGGGGGVDLEPFGGEIAFADRRMQRCHVQHRDDADAHPGERLAEQRGAASGRAARESARRLLTGAMGGVLREEVTDGVPAANAARGVRR